jgi:hypothetical protein
MGVMVPPIIDVVGLLRTATNSAANAAGRALPGL